MRNEFLLVLGSLMFFLSACGKGDFEVNRDAGSASSFEGFRSDDGDDGGGTDEPANAEEFYRQELFPLLTRDVSAGGCATAGCHLVDQGFSRSRTYFQVDPGSAQNSYRWAGGRRTELVQSIFLDPNSNPPPFTLKSQMESSHQSFTTWSLNDKAVLDEWVAYPE